MEKKKRMKVDLTFEIPDEIVKLFIKNGIKKEDVPPFIKALIGATIQQLFETLPETLVGLKAEAVDFEDVLKQWVNSGLKTGEEQRKKYEEKSEK